ncbi:MAG TPA: DUF488 domain-containing protein [Stellaceae bacterium]|jgi:uncharacterized protein (DUF488 family)|nr:DUF488 domain-containing protein [Stellaceae bacterium]
MTVFTIGHSTRSIEDFIAALKAAGVGVLADIRRFPKSRRYPHFNGENLAPALALAGIGYRPFPELGGRRGKRADGQPSGNTLWRQEPFRNYADYAETAEFRAAFDQLTALTRENTVAIMCAEAVWWQCHRRIVADYLLAAGFPVEHIFDAKKREPASLTPGAQPRGNGTILYEGEQRRLL